MNGFIDFTPAETRPMQLSRIVNQIRKLSQHTQNLFYYHEEDQLRQKDNRGWSPVEYLEHFNMILYHQIDVLNDAERKQKGVNVSKMIGTFLDSIGYKTIVRKSRAEFLIENFKPISISNPGVVLNPQKVFEDVIYGCEEFTHLMENEKNPYKIVIDKKIPGILTFRGKAQFLSEYFGYIIHRCSN